MRKRTFYNARNGIKGIILLALLLARVVSADHGPGVPVSSYVARNVDEVAILKLIRTVARGWERKNIDMIMSAYAPDAVQRAWNDSKTMIGYDSIREEALGAFRDPDVGQIRFEDWIHRFYVVNSSVVVEINQKFHGWGQNHYYRDLWIFGRRSNRWWLIRYDYEPQLPFDRQ